MAVADKMDLAEASPLRVVPRYPATVKDAEKIPILLMGDSPTGKTGLGRILRDLAIRIHENLSDVFDVATLGGGQAPDSSLPFPQYPMLKVKDWLVHDLPYAWYAHTRGREGILLSIWDVSRLLWLVHPEQIQDPDAAHVKNFLMHSNMRKWIYPAIDGAGPSGGLSVILKEALTKFERVVNYTKFSAGITGYPDALSHGVDTTVFYHREGGPELLKSKFGVDLDNGEHLIGIVATNQPRKDWAMAFGALALLKQAGYRARVWIHTDVDLRHWDLKSLYIDFGLQPNVKVFLTPYGLPDDDLAHLYSMCDVTLGIGPEGVGYPIAESLCCGTPCITGSYGGQSDFVPVEFMVDPIAYRYEGIFSVQRPVYNSQDFADKIIEVFKHPELREKAKPVLAWDAVWPAWEKWLRGGL